MIDETTDASDKPSPYWFKARRFGWGWGPPCCWQGWTVLLSYLVIVVASQAFVGHAAATALVLLATVALLGVTIAKGEPPRWRWGS